jgi:phosphatidylglycerophosphate synthase
LAQAITDSRGLVVADAKGATLPFRPVIRIQDNLLARSERRLLDRLCRALPSWVEPDHLTAIGVAGAALTATGYVGANWSTSFFLVACLGLVVNWFGDSLDGSLARHRKRERPRYGFFLDHSVDAISSLIISVGLGFSPYVSMDVALFCLVGYLCLGIFVLLFNQVSGEFRLSFLSCGPTEIRLIMIAFTLTMFGLGRVDLTILGRPFSLHALSVGLLGSVLIALFVANVAKTARKLAR